MKKGMIIGIIIAVAALVSVQADTAAIYKKQCVKCHGADGKGKMKMGKKLKAKDYTDAKVLEKMTDESMFKAIKEGLKVDGKTKMKPAKDVTDADVKALVAHMRAFSKK